VIMLSGDNGYIQLWVLFPARSSAAFTCHPLSRRDNSKKRRSRQGPVAAYPAVKAQRTGTVAGRAKSKEH